MNEGLAARGDLGARTQIKGQVLRGESGTFRTKLPLNVHLHHLCSEMSTSVDIDHAIAKADNFTLAANENYRRLQKRLIEKTVTLDIMRYVF